MVGGHSETKVPDETIHALVAEIKPSAEAKAGRTFEEFTAVSYTSQVVAGTKFRLKISVGSGEFVHVHVMRFLPHTNQAPEVQALHEGKTEGDEFE